MSLHIPYNKPHATGRELDYIAEAMRNGHLSGDGPFTTRCAAWLREAIGAHAVMLTHSCSGALEMIALLLEIAPGDEVIMPSYTFPTTAAAFALRGAVPVFVDIRPDTLCLDESAVEAAITPRTRAILAMHYAGVACDMARLGATAERHGVFLVEDAAQGLLSSHHGRPLGGIGTLAALSFHETKNVMCGQGGALVINDPRWVERAEMIRDKGTNRQAFYRGQVDHYSWVELGSSFLCSDLTAAFLWAQLEQAVPITRRRVDIWSRYHQAFEPLERDGRLRRPVVPPESGHNAHLYYLLLPDASAREPFLASLRQSGVHAVTHYAPLHTSAAGRRFGRACGELPQTIDASARLVRLPLWIDMSEAEIAHVIHSVRRAVAPHA